MANLFISHRGQDASQAEALAIDLRRSGHDVWLDLWRIDVGDSIIQRIDQGLQGATYVILCYSASGVNSPWMSREWMATLARQLNGRDVKLLPVRLTGGDPPAILEDIKYADLVADWETGLSELSRAIR